MTGTTITSSWANNTLNDLATAMTNSIATNGETPIVANLPMATFRHTGVGNAVGRTDYAAAGQIQDNSLVWGGVAGGTADALTLTLAPVLTAYVTGQRFLFISSASPNATTSPTLNVNGIAAKTFLRADGSAIVAGDIAATTVYEAMYNGTNMLLTSNSGVLLGAKGGTGIANTGKTITLGGNLTTSGAFATTLTATNTTAVTLPTSGTLATLAGSEALTNKTVNGATVTSTTGTLTLANSSTLATSGGNSITLTSTAGTNVTLPTTGTLATLAGSEALTNKTVNGATVTSTTGTLTLANSSTLATSGGNSITLTSTAGTNVTLPTSGTLLGTAAAVTVAQGGTGLATLTANNVILGNGASNVTFVAPGSTNNVLKSNGTTWTSGTVAGASLSFLSTVTAATSATVDIETTFDSTYDAYMIVGTGITTDGNVAINGRMKIGGSYDAGSNYTYHLSNSNSGSTTYSGQASAGTTSFMVLNNISGAAGDRCADFVMFVYKPSSTTLQKLVTWQGVSINSTPATAMNFGAAANSGTAALTGVRFLPASGNIVVGDFRLYGIAKS